MDPVLGPLANNGGPTQTHQLMGGSPAIGVVLKSGLCKKPDQRGVARTVPCGIGAYEAPMPARASYTPVQKPTPGGRKIETSGQSR